MSSNAVPQTADNEKVGIGGYISLIIAVLFFSPWKRLHFSPRQSRPKQ